MSEVTRILAALGEGERAAADMLLPLVYDELRRLAAARCPRGARPDSRGDGTRPRGLLAVSRRRSRPGRGTAGRTSSPRPPRPCGASSSRTPARNGGSGAAAGCIRASRARRPPRRHRAAARRAAGRRRGSRPTRRRRPSAAELVKLRYFAGFSIEQAAELLAISPRTANRLWTFARAWLRREIEASMSRPAKIFGVKSRRPSH